jgi:hypothetical protein
MVRPAASGKSGTDGDAEEGTAAGGSGAAAGGRWKSAKRRSAQRVAARQARGAGGSGGLERRVGGGREKKKGAELGRARRLWTPSIAGGDGGGGGGARDRGGLLLLLGDGEWQAVMCWHYCVLLQYSLLLFVFLFFLGDFQEFGPTLYSLITTSLNLNTSRASCPDEVITILSLLLAVL